MLFGKYEYRKRYSITQLIGVYQRSWAISALAALLFLSLSHDHGISRQMILSNIFGLLIGESLMVLVVSIFRGSVPILTPDEIDEKTEVDPSLLEPLPEGDEDSGETLLGMPALKKAPPALRSFMANQCPVNGNNGCLVIDTADSTSRSLLFPRRATTPCQPPPLNRTKYNNHFLEVATAVCRKGDS
jgi:hypothetical protein